MGGNLFIKTTSRTWGREERSGNLSIKTTSRRSQEGTTHGREKERSGYLFIKTTS